MRILALVIVMAATGALVIAAVADRDPVAAVFPPGPPGNVGELPAHGLNAWENSTITPGQLDAIRASGAPYYRFNMITSFVDWHGDGRTTRYYDRLVRQATVRRITLLPVLMRLRKIELPEPPRTEAEHDQWRVRVGFFAARYGPGGAYWRENPGLPYRPIRVWEIWNEPNLREFWGDRAPDPLPTGGCSPRAAPGCGRPILRRASSRRGSPGATTAGAT